MVSSLAKKILPKTVPQTEIPRSPVKWTSIPLSEVFEQDKRLEASVFDIKGKQARNIILNGKYPSKYLNGSNGLIKTAFYPGRFKRLYCESSFGEAFYLPSQMKDIYPKPEKYILKLTKCNLDELRLKKNTLLLTRSGTIGNIAYVSRTLEGKIFSDDVIRITFHNNVDLGYVYTYLKSKIGNLILQTNGYGSVITHIEPEHLDNIPVPDPPDIIKQEINGLIERSFSLCDESNEFIDKATQLLINELELPPINKLSKKVLNNKAEVETFQVKLSQLSGRTDASYFVPIINSIEEHLKKYSAELTTVGDVCISKDIILPGRFKRVYVEEGYGRVFIGGKQLFELDPSNKKYLSLLKHSKQIEKEMEIDENYILITRSGTIGKVALAPKHWRNWIVNEHIIRVIPASQEIAGYLYTFLSSDYGSHLIKRFTYGSVVDEIDANHVSQITVPLLKNQAMQKEINDLALKANTKRTEAYELEQKALKLMDKIIYS